MKPHGSPFPVPSLGPSGPAGSYGSMTEASSFDPTRATLLLRLKPGHDDREMAWSEFFKLYVPVIRSFARSRGASIALVDDVVQEVLKRFFQASPQFQYDPAKGRFRGYLKTCTIRVLSDLSRTPVCTQSSAELPDVAAKTTEDAWDVDWERQRAKLAMETVRRQYSRRADSAITFRAFEMYAVFEHPADAVALDLGISVASVHAAKSRVLIALRKAAESLSEVLD